MRVAGPFQFCNNLPYVQEPESWGDEAHFIPTWLPSAKAFHRLNIPTGAVSDSLFSGANIRFFNVSSRAHLPSCSCAKALNQNHRLHSTQQEIGCYSMLQQSSSFLPFLLKHFAPHFIIHCIINAVRPDEPKDGRTNEEFHSATLPLSFCFPNCNNSKSGGGHSTDVGLHFQRWNVTWFLPFLCVFHITKHENKKLKFPKLLLRHEIVVKPTWL